MTDAQRFHELTGLELPENYNAADILKRMKEKCGEGKHDLFMAQLEYGNSPEVEPQDWSGMIDVAYVENSTALLREAVEFLEQTKGEGK